MNSGNYIASDFKDPPNDEGMILSFKKEHKQQCSNCGEYEGQCLCQNPSWFDVWTFYFDHFEIEIYNEFYHLELDHYKGNIPNYFIEPINLVLISDLKNKIYKVILEFENGKAYLTINN